MSVKCDLYVNLCLKTLKLKVFISILYIEKYRGKDDQCQIFFLREFTIRYAKQNYTNTSNVVKWFYNRETENII